MAAPDLASRVSRHLDGAPFGVAVSGGGDSVALLLAAHDAAPGRVRAATVDHGLRPEAAAEARLVADLCAARAIPHAVLAVDLRDGPGLQARARAARYAALGAWQDREGLSPCLLGHTADDVAEGLVMRLRRGVGADGLARMPERWTDERGRAWARPFLDVSRAALRDALRSRGIAWAEDPSNDDPRHERAATRAAMRALGWDAAPLARTATFLREAADSLAARTRDLLARHATQDRGDLLLDREAMERLRAQEPEQARRLLLCGLAWIGGAAPRGKEVDRLVAALAASGAPRTLAGVVLAPGDPVRLSREPAACGPPVASGAVWDGRWRVDGPPGTVSALGGDLRLCRWRGSGLPRGSLLASPALRSPEGDLVAAPLAGFGPARAHVTRPLGPIPRDGGGRVD